MDLEKTVAVGESSDVKPLNNVTTENFEDEKFEDGKFDDVATGKLEYTVICPICLDEFNTNNSQTLVTLHCLHQFHLDCIGTHFNYKKRMECPVCREVVNERWTCSGGPNGGQNLDSTLDGAGHVYVVNFMPLECIWDSQDELAESQMMSESEYYSDPVDTSTPPSEGVLPSDAPFLFSPQSTDPEMEDDDLDYFEPDLDSVVMTFHRLSVGSGTLDEAGAAESFTSEMWSGRLMGMSPLADF